MTASLPLLGQEKLYPVRGNKDVPALLTADRSAIVLEKAFQHKLTLGFPTDDQTSFLPKTRTPLVMLWLTVRNVTQRPMELNVAKFISTDNEGAAHAALAPEPAFNRIMEGVSAGSIGTKTLRGISLGRIGNNPTEDDVKEDFVRHTLQSGQIAPGAAKEGLIFFEAPRQKKFTVNITLGDLWSTPLMFSTEKSK